MQIVIDKESLITLFTVGFYAICGGDYSDVKNTVIEMLDKVGYTPLPKGHKRLIEDNFEVGPVFDEEGNRVGYRYVTQYDLDNAPTIIDADKESGNGEVR